jgi:RecA-family ATPase
MNDLAPFTDEIFKPKGAVSNDRAPRDLEGRAAPPKPKIVRPADLSGEPPLREWLVPHWIPVGVVTGLYGDGGVGKSLIAQQLQTGCALALPWLGLPVEQCASLGVYCEDSQDELHRRQADINLSYGREYDALTDVNWMPRLGEDNLLMTFGRNGVGELTPFHRNLTEAALDLSAKLVIVDTAADVFGGNENDRGQVRQFVSRALGSIAIAINGAVLLCAHPSRTGLSSGEGDGGSTGWSNSLRSRLFLRAPDALDGEAPDPNARILQRRKANYAARQDELRLRWNEGCIEPEARAASSSGSFGRRAVEDVFLDLLDAFERENQRISESKNAGNYAPASFAKRPERDGYRKPDFERAMQTLFSRGAIRIVEYGPPSKIQRRIERVRK